MLADDADADDATVVVGSRLPMEKKRGDAVSGPSSPGRPKRPFADSGVRSRADELATQMERLSRRAETAQHYVSVAAHEILTPLTIAKGEIELALRQGREAGQDQATFEVLLGQIQQLITLSQRMLALASAGAPEGQPPSTALRLREVVDRAVAACVAAAPVVRGIDVRVDDVTLEGRAEDLVRLVRNVVENAMEHGPQGSRIRVDGRLRRRSDDKVVLLSVEDDGPGIPEELRDRIFDPFFRIQSPRYRSGAGLGLAIAREIARAHGGDLWVDASSETTRFVAVLPVRSA